ncbi:type II toxin-antitoxin system VapC family toxin [Planotetraspora sp. A-T 1434]|uniref:type II toxin-antitoxin system VapC family toxin n=1 Tax=Planotetraspora sp. A-T 1434 TaxID=2979219 RepID=UPI0021BDFC65|nr:type II toxin-antitoxin system VapC family toxin [Planotetraspora sp. A-T 1434]MCT9928874.1 type II toxin-antitoxin system VapC family toxin [Planotetraspora sp. A-T 1434]
MLLDTHVVLWWLTNDPTLADEIKEAIDEEPQVFVSSATLWEVAIKQSMGKLAAPDDLVERIADSGFRELPVRFGHAIELGRLPLLHRDPFDRLLIAQARCERLFLVTRDGHIPKYDVQVMTV